MNKRTVDAAEEIKAMTDEERLELAAKLDSELDAFINGLEKQRYTEGWPEDRWQEEMEKHPFFMKKAPEPGDEVHPMFEGLQKLKYDPEENTKEDLALNYKDDGNFYLKHKKFSMAICSYTEGIKIKCENSELNAILYNNRSAAHFFLKNYRSALIDAEKALELKPDYHKARWRAAQCSYNLDKFDLCDQFCEQIIEKQVNLQAKELLKKNKAKKLEMGRDKRKEVLAAKKKYYTFQNTVDLLKERKVKFDDLQDHEPITEHVLQPKFAPLESYPVHIDDNGMLVWPVAFSYPEFLLSDFHQELTEAIRMDDCIAAIFAEPLECDKENKYRPGNVNVYYENCLTGVVHKIDLTHTIREILTEPNFYVTGGSLLFYVVPIGSEVEEKFITEDRRNGFYAY